MSSSKTVATNVANTYELVEQILLYLPLPQLLLAQRTNKFFQGVINDSDKIQQALFLAPATDETIESYGDGQWSWRVPDRAGWRVSEDSVNVTPILNPFITMLENGFMPDIHQHTVSRAKDEGDVVSTVQASGFRPHGRRSLGAMLLTHPPARKVVYGNWQESEIPGRDKSVNVSNDTGVRFGELVAAHQKLPAAVFKGFIKPATKGYATWKEVPVSVREITGWGMLEVLHASNTARLEMLNGWRTEKIRKQMSAIQGRPWEGDVERCEQCGGSSVGCFC